jgi:hypothetical protein
MQIIVSIVMTFGGIIIYKLLADYTDFVSWPGLIISGLGLLYLVVHLVTQKRLNTNRGVRIGALILGFGVLTSLLVPIVFSGYSFGGFAYLYTIPFVVTGVLVILVSSLASTLRNRDEKNS